MFSQAHSTGLGTFLYGLHIQGMTRCNLTLAMEAHHGLGVECSSWRDVEHLDISTASYLDLCPQRNAAGAWLCIYRSDWPFVGYEKLMWSVANPRVRTTTLRNLLRIAVELRRAAQALEDVEARTMMGRLM